MSRQREGSATTPEDQFSKAAVDLEIRSTIAGDVIGTGKTTGKALRTVLSGSAVRPSVDTEGISILLPITVTMIL
jgi:predicted RNA-binding protein YlqC (UPF0109 family)